MKWIDYREKLGIGINDIEKTSLFSNKLSISLGDLYSYASQKGLYKQWNSTCSDYYYEVGNGIGQTDKNTVIASITKHFDIKIVICHYVAFMNAFCKHFVDEQSQMIIRNMLYKALIETRIPYEIIEDKDGIFVFPKGAKELDDALVSEPLEWLKEYPIARKTYVSALKQYSEGEYIRDIADNLRKTLEDFLREFLNNDKDLNCNKKEVETYLKDHSADQNLIKMLVSLISHYYLLNNETAKHKEKIDKKYLEFLLYQTGIFIRMLITLKQEDKTNAD